MCGSVPQSMRCPNEPNGLCPVDELRPPEDLTTPADIGVTVPPDALMTLDIARSPVDMMSTPVDLTPVPKTTGAVYATMSCGIKDMDMDRGVSVYNNVRGTREARDRLKIVCDGGGNGQVAIYDFDSSSFPPRPARPNNLTLLSPISRLSIRPIQFETALESGVITIMSDRGVVSFDPENPLRQVSPQSIDDFGTVVGGRLELQSAARTTIGQDTYIYLPGHDQMTGKDVLRSYKVDSSERVDLGTKREIELTGQNPSAVVLLSPMAGNLSVAVLSTDGVNGDGVIEVVDVVNWKITEAYNLGRPLAPAKELAASSVMFAAKSADGYQVIFVNRKDGGRDFYTVTQEIQDITVLNSTAYVSTKTDVYVIDFGIACIPILRQHLKSFGCDLGSSAAYESARTFVFVTDVSDRCVAGHPKTLIRWFEPIPQSLSVGECQPVRDAGISTRDSSPDLYCEGEENRYDEACNPSTPAKPPDMQ